MTARVLQNQENTRGHRPRLQCFNCSLQVRTELPGDLCALRSKYRFAQAAELSSQTHIRGVPYLGSFGTGFRQVQPGICCNPPGQSDRLSSDLCLDGVGSFDLDDLDDDLESERYK